MTQISDAKKGILTDEMKHVAKIENVSEDFILNSSRLMLKVKMNIMQKSLAL